MVNVISLDYHFKTIIDNGLRVLVVSDLQCPYVHISLIGKVGRRAEKENEIGAAHFLEHLFFDGTKQRPSPYEINKFIEDNGGIKNGFTSTEIVEYFVKVITEKAEVGFEYLSDIFQNSLLTEIDKEKMVITQEAKMKRDNPDDLISRIRSSTLYPNQPMGRTIFDEEERLANINQDILKQYMDRVYNSRNFILCISGNITEKTALKLAKQYFGQIKTGNESRFDEPKINLDQTIKVIQRDIKQAKLSIAFKGFPSYSPESIYLQLVNIVLGSGFSSRLYERLRNNLHLVYFITCARESYSDTGYTYIQTFLDESNIQNAIDESFAEINKMVGNGLNDQELNKAKNIYQSRFLFDFDKASFRSHFYGHQWLIKGEILPLSVFLKRAEDSTEQDLLNIANVVFSDQPKINIISKNSMDIRHLSGTIKSG